MRPTIRIQQWASVLTAALVLASCATQRSFDRVTARSAEVKRAIAAEADNIIASEQDQTRRDERIRYLARVTDVVNNIDRQLLSAMTRELSSPQERIVESAFLLALDSMELYARFPGRVTADGKPADEITQQSLRGLSEDANLASGP